MSATQDFKNHFQELFLDAAQISTEWAAFANRLSDNTNNYIRKPLTIEEVREHFQSVEELTRKIKKELAEFMTVSDEEDNKN